MKRVCSLLMVLCVLFSVTVQAKVPESNGLIVVDSIESDVVKISTEDFNEAFVGEPLKRKDYRNLASYSDAEIQINDMTIMGDVIEFSFMINGANKAEINGTLKSGYKYEHGLNSIVADVSSSLPKYDILYFEILNDKDKNSALLKKNSNGQPILKLYIKDNDENIYLFEEMLPKSLQVLDAADYEKGNKSLAYWFKDFVDPYEEEELVTTTELMEELGLSTVQSRALNSFSTWTNPTTYYTSFYVGSDYTQCWSLPYLRYKHTDVNSNDSTWIASFKVAEHTRVNGSLVYHGNNVFEYRNLKLSFGSGEKTTIIRTFQEGRVYDYTASWNALKEEGEKIAVSIYKNVISSIPVASDLDDIVSRISAVAGANGDVTLGSTGINLSSDLCNVVGEELEDYSLEECTDYDNQTEKGHYFTFHAVTQFEGSGSASTFGALCLEFDVLNWETGSLTNRTKNIQLNYTASN